MSQECANPLLLELIKEWLDKAKEQNSKGVFTYRKAYQSMKACPIAFDHPSQAQELHGIGPKLCDRLAEKLAEHHKQNGTTMPPDPRKAKQKKRKSDELNTAAGEEEEETIAQKPVKKARKPKPYVPALRTGPYAILLALSTLSEISSNGMTKQHLIELAQPHCDSSFTAPSEPTKTYTAWSAMKTLQVKDLVYMSGGARKTYTLTDEGWEVAKKIKVANGLSNAAITGQSESGIDFMRTSAQPEEQAKDISSIGSKQLGDRKPLGRSRTEVQHDCNDHEESVGLDAAEGEASTLSALRQPFGTSNNTEEGLLPPIRKPSKLSRSYIDSDFIDILSSSPQLLPEIPRDRREPLQSIVLPNLNTNRPALNHVQSNGKLPTARPTKLPTDNQNPPFTPIIIPPSAYTIELLLDNREVRSKSDRDYIQSGLLTQGIRPTTRARPVGDALWVARLTSPSSLPPDEEGSEIVLDHILERKRLDDLVGSIKDGRFTEQKFRLKKSGAKNVTYLIEDYNLGHETQAYYHEHVCSAIASTMVVSGFFIKRTKNVDDTIAYLARLTRLLRQTYEGKELRVIPSGVIDAYSADATTPLPALRAQLGEPCYITYNAFSNLSGKSDTLNLRDVYLKMLMCARGLTGEKALEVQRVWKTPRELVEAFREAGDDKAKEDLVWKNLGAGIGKRKIGKALSKNIAKVWGGVQ